MGDTKCTNKEHIINFIKDNKIIDIITKDEKDKNIWTKRLELVDWPNLYKPDKPDKKNEKKNKKFYE